ETFTGQAPYFGKTEIGVWSAVVMRKEVPSRPINQMPTDSSQGDLIWSPLKSCWSNEPSDRPASLEVAQI
ncbi:hypothetical protein FRC07_006489, partial [Ceratobasidium sp. 392]